MIIIKNISKEFHPFSEQLYEVCLVNELIFEKERICTFKHKRIEGIGKRILAAAKAVEKAKWEEIAKNIR